MDVKMLIELFIIAISCQFSTQTEQYVLLYERMGDLITLKCRDTTTDSDLPVGSDAGENVRFWVNRTRGIRFGEPDIQQRNDVQATTDNQNVSVRFLITRALEGYYSCGYNSSATESDIKYLISLNRSLCVSQPTIYSQSGEEMQLSCSSQPGNLRDCYFGRWLKDSHAVVEVERPLITNFGLCTPQETMYTNKSKYHLDRNSFSLTVQSIKKSDGGNYHCELSVLNPESVNRDIWPFQSTLVSLQVDGQPLILEAPRDVVVGLDTTRERLMETATFNCTALGRPIPEIEWFYITINPDGTPGTPERLKTGDRVNIVNSDGAEDPTRRYQRTSTLTMAVTENDGGIIRCKADRFYKDAHLTVLSKPSINIIETLRGEIIYDIELKVHIYHPVTLNFTYQDVDNGAYFSRDSQPDETYNDTKEITYRENKKDVPAECRRCQVAVSLTAMSRSEVTQGLSVTSSDVIDVEARTPEQTIEHLHTTIAISCAVLSTVIGVGGIMITIVVCNFFLWKRKQKEQQLNLEHQHKEEQMELEHKHKEEQLVSEHQHRNEIAVKTLDSVEENVDDLGDTMDDANRKRMIERTKKKLKELKEFMKEESTCIEDDYSKDTPQVNLQEVDECLEELLSKFKAQRRR